MGTGGAAAWTQLAANTPASASAPAGRSGAVLLPAGGGGGVALAGGCSSSCCYAPLADVWVFAGGAWANATQRGVPALPAPRLYHSSSAAANASSSFVFGGTDIVTGTLNDLWLVTLARDAAGAWSAAWQLLSADDGASPALPSPRTGQSQTALPARTQGGARDGSFVLFGGIGELAMVDDVWLWMTKSGGASGAGAFAAVTGIAAGSGPGPRIQHAALVVALPLPGGGGRVSRVLVVSGGSDDNGDSHDDVWALALDATPPAWLLLGSSATSGGAAPWSSVRHGHAIWAAAASPLVAATRDVAGAVVAFTLFGGQNCSVPDPANFLADTWGFSVALAVASDGGISLAAGTGAFTLLSAGGVDAPSPRALGGIVAPDAAGSTIYASGFGGYAGGTDDRLYNDVWQSQ